MLVGFDSVSSKRYTPILFEALRVLGLRYNSIYLSIHLNKSSLADQQDPFHLTRYSGVL